MSGLTSWLWGTSQLDDAVDKATSELLPAGGEDIALNLEICDQIRSKSVPAKDAMRAVKRRLNHKNPNVQNLALSLTDICVKNGGDHFLTEIASREFMDNLVSILKIPMLNNDVKNNILRLVQNWNFAFEGKPLLSYVGQVYRTLMGEGFKFPPKDLAVANAAMVDSQTAPEWIDSDVCLRCRTPFSFTNRKHHCRNCGRVFDQACSSKSMALPHFGITQDVRVCDSCYTKITKKADKTDKGHRHSASLPITRHRSARDLADEELQRAIQLSLQEAGPSGHARPGYVPSQPNWQSSEPPIVDRTFHRDIKSSADEEDPDLKAAIEASLREMNAPKPSAPIASESPRAHSTPSVAVVPSVPPVPSYDLEPLESDAILTFSQTIEQVEAQGGRDISRYPAVNELYDKANGLRPKLALSLDDAGRKEQMLSDMHDKLSQAVKLYDKLLTEQIARPSWRSPQPAVDSYHANSSAVNGYTQWMSSAPVTATPKLQLSSPQASHSQLSQGEPRVVTSPSQWQRMPAYQYAQPNQQPYSSIPAQASPTSVSVSPQLLPEPSQIHQQPALQSPVLPPVSLNTQQYQYSSPATVLQIPPPIQYAAHPPPPLQQSTHPRAAAPIPPSSPNRAKSISYGSSPPAAVASPPTINGHLGRSNTVATRPPTHNHSLSYTHPSHTSGQSALQPLHVQQQLMLAPTPPSNVIPDFPAVPTEAPQGYSMYRKAVGAGPGVGPPMEVQERKEAALIDL